MGIITRENLRRALVKLYERSSEWGYDDVRRISNRDARIAVAYSQGVENVKREDQAKYLAELERLGWVKRAGKRVLLVFRPK